MSQRIGPTGPEERARINNLVDEVAVLNRRGVVDADFIRAVSTLHSYVFASASALGECRKKTPYKPLKPVIQADGSFQWCCEHDPEHCV